MLPARARQKKISRWVLEALVLLFLAVVFFAVFSNVQAHFQTKGLKFGFGFLGEVAGFDISETFPFPWFGAGEHSHQWRIFGSGERC